jgi:hypothetical protein
MTNLVVQLDVIPSSSLGNHIIGFVRSLQTFCCARPLGFTPVIQQLTVKTSLRARTTGAIISDRSFRLVAALTCL